MCVDISHLIFETLCDTDYQVVDESSNRAEGGDVLSGTVVQLNLDDILLGMREVDRQVVEVLGELACSFSVRIPSCLQMLPICCVPRGPSTVTSRDLMVTLTIRGNKSVIVLLSMRQLELYVVVKFCQAPLAELLGSGRPIALTSLRDVQGLG